MADPLELEVETRTCVRCGRELEPAEVYFRFRVIVEGDQDLAALAASPAGESPGDLLARMEREGDWERYD
ncbi:MAG: hypothetical protein QGG40_18525, partial [Myxococcota bacterium]|nr:hypothetical protein [Myxococcota bacterium]